MPRPREYLEKAGSLLEGERGQDYGDYSINFSNIAKGWSVILGIHVTPEQVGLALTWLKMARLVSPTISDSATDDCYEDGIAYLAIGAVLGGRGQIGD